MAVADRLRALRQPETWQVLSRRRRGQAALFAASFLETTVVPIPMELVLVPLYMADRKRLWRAATIALAGCILAACLMYAVGLFLTDTVGAWVMDAMNWQRQFDRFRADLANKGFWLILAIGILPVPFQLATLGAGIVDYSFPLFLLATVMSRGLRYYGLALAVFLFGERARRAVKAMGPRERAVLGVLSAGIVALLVVRL